MDNEEFRTLKVEDGRVRVDIGAQKLVSFFQK